MIDLSRLSGSVYTVPIAQGRKFIYSVCQTLPKSYPDLPSECYGKGACLLQGNILLATFTVSDPPIFNSENRHVSIRFSGKYDEKTKFSCPPHLSVEFVYSHIGRDLAPEDWFTLFSKKKSENSEKSADFLSVEIYF